MKEEKTSCVTKNCRTESNGVFVFALYVKGMTKTDEDSRILNPKYSKKYYIESLKDVKNNSALYISYIN